MPLTSHNVLFVEILDYRLSVLIGIFIVENICVAVHMGFLLENKKKKERKRVFLGISLYNSRFIQHNVQGHHEVET